MIVGFRRRLSDCPPQRRLSASAEIVSLRRRLVTRSYAASLQDHIIMIFALFTLNTTKLFQALSKEF